MKALLRKIRQILKDRRTRRFLTRFVSGVAAIVVFVTTYALVLPAITMESEAACGIEAHQHDDSCYSENLICGQEESEGHHHTDDCYTVSRNLECDLEEHQHSSENGCFDEEGNVVCKLEEHTHSDSCYKEHRELTCGLEETEGHHHTDSCYEKVLTCGKEVHTHSTACYKADLQIESAAVASTGMTSAAAVPDFSDNDYEAEDSKDDSIVSESLDEEDADDAITPENNSEDKTDADADIKDESADQNDTNAGSDNVDKDGKKDKDSSKEGEEAASSFSTGFAADEDTENGDAYIPEKDALDFNTVLNSRTGIYYHHVAEDEEIEDSSAITDWNKADKDTKLNPEDLIRIYLSYTLPKDTINATNDISRYRLPDTLHLTDEQIEAINNCENGISAQYIDYDNLEITDPERHAAYLGLESVEGRRLPGEELKGDNQEFISAVVRAEKIYDEDSGEYEGTDLIFTFSPYAVEKNAHAYDKKGQPTRAGEEVTGWLTLDFNMGQIDWAEDNTSEIVFSEEDKINTVLRQADPDDAETDESAADGTTEAAAEYATEEVAAADITSEKTAEAGTENAAAETTEDIKDAKTDNEKTAASYPAAVFDDSITVNSGRLDTDLADTDLPQKTKMTVHVEADEGTFPEGTKMVLSAVEDLDAVAEAVGTAVDEKKTRGFQAVDITFYDKDPSEEDAKEIEPLKPIRVSIKSDEIKKAAEDSSTAPVVVHIEDDNTAKEIENTASKTDKAVIEIEKPASSQQSTSDSATRNDDDKDNASEANTPDNAESSSTAATDDAVDFEADSFSVYAVVYTVELQTEVLTASGDSYAVTVTCGEDAQIPNNAKLSVREILSTDEEYDSFYNSAVEKACSDAEKQGIEMPIISGARLFDIEIQSEDGKIEPAAPVQVSIRLIGKKTADHTSVVHFGKDGTEALEAKTSEIQMSGTSKAADETAETAESETTEPDAQETAEESNHKKAVTEVSFSAESFSVYSVVNVTDFNTIAESGKKYALVTGIAGDPGATTGYSESWGRDYFTIIVNAHALSDQIAYDGNNSVNGLQVEPVHAYEDGSVSYVGGNPVQWQFVSAGNGKYYLTANGKYLRRYNKNGYNHQYGWETQLTDNSNEATQLSIDVNSDDGTILIHDGNYYLYEEGNYNSAYTNGEWATRFFRFTDQGVDTNSQAYRFRVCEESDQFDSFAARKVSVQNLTVNDNFLIYRKFEDSKGNELLYALASDGTFVRVYDGGDTVYWRETNKNLYWNYRLEGGYYSVYSTNPLTGETVYINPMHSEPSQTITTEPSRLTLIGKDNGDYGTALENWDQTAYDYAGLHVTLNDGTPVLSTGTRVAGTSDYFLFAVASTMPGSAAETVETVDSEALGIHITMFDYGRDDHEYNAGDKLDSMAEVVDSNTNTANAYTPHAAHALVKPYLENDLPSSKTQGAMTGLFTSDGSAVTYSQSGVTNLFLKSYYDENGMFRYRSEDNYAYLGKGGNTSFTVYRQAATPYPYDTQPGHTYYTHGHYMPFNDIDMTKNVSRLMNQYGNEYTNGEIVGELPVGDGRTYEDIYGTKGIPNFFTGMKLEADFTQLKDGITDSGDPMVFKFTGDDDMWVYIDGVLVLDVGGIHEPLSGTIDFSTGEVNNPTGSSLAGKKTLYDIFMAVLNNSSTPQATKDKINSITWKDVNNDGKPDTFADYTNHEFKAFYMERGAGASNLDIQFNLKVVRPGEFVVEKEMPEGVDPRFVNQEYRFQATFKDYKNNNEVKPLNKDATDKDGTSVCSGIYYKDRKDAEGNPVEVPVDEDGYFTLKAGEAAVFKMTDKKIEYTVNEVDIDTDQKIEEVEINGQVVQVSDGTAAAAYAKAGDRSQLKYKNHPYLQNLNIIKHLLPEGTQAATGDVFEFRVYLETRIEVDGEEVQQLVPYSYAPYYVTKLVDGTTHYYTLTGENNAPVDRGTNPVVCSTTGRSGSINSIPPEYTVVVPNLAVGTHFYIEERRDNIPAGYVFDHEDLIADTYDEQNLGSDDVIISRILARDEKDHQEFDHNTVGRIKKGVDARSEVFNRKTNVKVQKQWLKMNGTPYNLEQVRQLPGSTGAVITAELWKKSIVEEAEEKDPVTVTFMVKTTEESDYRMVSTPVTIKNGSTLEFSLGARGTSQAEEIHSDPEYTISRSSVSSNPKIHYSNGREKDKWSKYTIDSISENITVYATFDAEKVSDDFVGLYIASMEEPGASSTPVEEKVADITLNNGNDWLQQVSMEQGYTYFLRNIVETGLEEYEHQYIFIDTPTVEPDEDGNLVIAVANKYREPINITVEKKWSPALTSEEENNAYVTVELHRYAKKTKGVLDVVLKDNYGAPIEGAVFKLYKDGVAQEQDYTTDVNGKIAANNLEPGTYYFKQISTPEGYSMPDPAPQTENFVVEDNKTVPQEKHCELLNQALETNGVAVITLVDNNGAPIEGAKYSLIKREGTHETVIKENLLTDENGQITVSQLKAGTYYFFEVEPPAGYKLPDYWQDTDFTVREQPGTVQHFNLNMTNDLKGNGYVEVTLTGPNERLISGAVFELYNGSEKLAEGITDNNGKLTFGDPERLAVGTYIVKQITTDSDLVPDGEAQEFKILENGEINQKKELGFTNQYRGKGTATVTLTRKDNGAPISGATFELYMDGSLFDTKTTNSDGQLTFGDPNKLPVGNYSIKQTSTVEGLEPVKTIDSFAILENGNPNQTHIWDVKNEDEAGNVTIKLWRKGGFGQWNWDNIATYTELKPGRTYSFTATLSSGLYPNFVWYYQDESDHNNYDAIWQNQAHSLDSTGWDSSTNSYHFTITPTKDDTLYSYVLISGWGATNIETMSMDEGSRQASAPTANRSAAPKALLRSPSNAPAQADGPDQNDSASADDGNTSATRDVQVVVNPSGPPSDDYIVDTAFVQTYTIRKSDLWKHTFPNLDRFDRDQNPYYYYVVETACEPSTYHLASYANDNLSETGTITINNTYEAVGTLNFNAAKFFKGGELGGEDNTQFTFKLTQVTGNNSTTQATSNVILASPEIKTTTAESGSTDTVNFTSITLRKDPTIDQTGEYWFMLEEVIPEGVDANNEKDGIRYPNPARKWIKVIVTDNRDGTLNIAKSPSESAGVDGTWTNEKFISVTAYKAWLDIDGGNLSNAPEGASVEFTLYANGNATEHKVTLDGTVDTNGEIEAWVARFDKLPAADENGDVITYTVVETRGYDEFKQVTVTFDENDNPTITDGGSPVSDNGTIYNQKIRVIRAYKNWLDKNGNPMSAPGGGTATIQLYKVTEGSSSVNKEFVSEVVLNGTTDENGEETAWVATFRNLEADADYIVEETHLSEDFKLVSSEAVITESTETKDFWVRTNELSEGEFLIVGDPYAYRSDILQGSSINSLVAPQHKYIFTIRKRPTADGFDLYDFDGTNAKLSGYDGWTYENRVMKALRLSNNAYYYIDLTRQTSCVQPLDNTSGKPVTLYKKYTVPASGDYIFNVTNQQKRTDLGSLIINKKVYLGSEPDGNAPETTYTFGIYNAPYNSGADPVRTVDLTVNGAEGSTTVLNLEYGNYVVYELDGEGNPITGEHATIGGKYYKVEYKDNPATPVTVDENTTPAIEVRNTVETVSLEGDKIWHIIGETLPADSVLTLTRVSSKSGSTPEVVKDSEENNLQPAWSAVAGEANKRHFLYNNLPKYDAEGYQYTYTVAEASFTANGKTYTVTRDNNTYVVKVGDETVDTFVVTQDGNNITNTEKKEFSFTKEWYGAQPGSIEWPQDKSGNDIPITVTVTGKKSGASDIEITKTLTSQSPEVTRNEYDFYVVTFTGLDIDYEYKVTEASVDGYHTEYYMNGSSDPQLSGITWTDNGGTIKNILTVYELPESGGMGTMIFYLLGITLIGLAFAGFVIKRSRREEAL